MKSPVPVERVRGGLAHWGLGNAELVRLPPGVTADVFLITLGDDRSVAKLAYQSRSEFEPGLIVSRHLRGKGMVVAAPRSPSGGGLLVMVEWPEGHWHPMAVLDFVPGSPLDLGSPAAPQVLGDVCGSLHQMLSDLRLQSSAAWPGDYLGYLRRTTEDLGDFAWLHDLNAEIAAAAMTNHHQEEIRWTTNVWDGPDVLIDSQDGVGLVDFGNVGWHPFVHVVANRSLLIDDAERSQARFLGSVEQRVELHRDERALLPLFRLVNVAIYAKYAAWSSNAATLERLLPKLREGRNLIEVV